MFDNVAAVVAGPDFVLEYPAQHPLAFGLFPRQCLYQPELGLDSPENIEPQIFDLAFEDFPRTVVINDQTIPDKFEIGERLQNFPSSAPPLDKANFATVLELRRTLKEYLGLLEDDNIIINNIIINNIINMSCQTYFNLGYTLLSIYLRVLFEYGGVLENAYGLFSQEKSLKLSVVKNIKDGFYNLLQEYQIAYKGFYIPSQDRCITLGEEKPVCIVKIKIKISLAAEYPTIVQLIKFESYHWEVTHYLARLHQSIMSGAIVQAHREELEINRINIKQISKQVIEPDEASTVELFNFFNLKYRFMNNRTLSDPDKKLLSETKRFFFGMTSARNKVCDVSFMHIPDTPGGIEKAVRIMLQNDTLTDVQIANICRRCNLHMSNPAIFVCQALKNWLATQNIFLKKSRVIEPVFGAEPEREIDISMLPGNSNYMEQTLHVKFLVINYHGELRHAEHLGGKPRGIVLEIFIYCHIPLAAELPIELKKFLISSECPILQPILEQLKATNLATFVNKFDDF